MIKHVYMHIPFCKYICSYCDFCKKYIKNQPVDKYLSALEQEIGEKITKKQKINTLYIGGGTPSALEINELKQLQQIIAKFFVFDTEYEFTFECNPDDISVEKMELLTAMGVNRISMGVQVLNDQLLTNLKRKHTVSDVKKAIEIAQKYLRNISCDFIFNLPEQTMSDLEASIALIEEYKLTHVSYYGLILEENTILDTQEYELQDEDNEASWYYYLQEKLTELGYIQYEISNYARKEKFTSKHNLAYWQQREYYGFGLGASGYEKNLRYTNTKSLQHYLKNPMEKLFIEEINLSDLNEEKILLNLRTSYGIEKAFIEQNQLTISDKYFEQIGENIRIKSDYFYLSSEIIVDLLMQIERNLCKDTL